MTSSAAQEWTCDVLIAGLGPVGATLAALLAGHGLSIIVVEPETGVYPLPRAAHIDHEVMRIFQAIGITAAIAPHLRVAPDYEFLTKNGETLMRIERDGVAGASGWAVSYNVYQPGIEQALRSRLAELPCVEVRLGCRLARIVHSGPDEVRAIIDLGSQSAHCTARFLVGCDGAWSEVREASEIMLDDYKFDEPWLVIDALVPDESGFPVNNQQVCDADRPTSFVHMGPGRLRWEFMLKPEEVPEAMTTDGAINQLLETWRQYGEIKVERRAVYRFHGLVADRWRADRVFIAGDAAHQMPPFMGQGMCSGLRDVANLAWKIATAIRHGVGHGSTEALLDSYQQEREPHVRDVVARAIEMGRLVCTLDPIAAEARDRRLAAAPRIGQPSAFGPFAQGCLLAETAGAGSLFPQWRDPASGLRSDDVLGPGAWLLRRASGPPGGTSGPISRFAVADLPAHLAAATGQWLEDHGVDAVLVRPDRTVFGTGDPDHLCAAYESWIGMVNDTSGTDPPAVQVR